MYILFLLLFMHILLIILMKKKLCAVKFNLKNHRILNILTFYSKLKLQLFCKDIVYACVCVCV